MDTGTPDHHRCPAAGAGPCNRVAVMQQPLPQGRGQGRPETNLSGLPETRVVTIVLNYQNPEDTEACVSALRRSTDLDQSLIVVDNGPSGTPENDRLKSLVGSHGVLLTTGGNLGYAAGNNVGIRLALQQRPEFIWLVNPDLRVEPNTLELLLDTADTFRDAAAIGPRIVYGGAGPTRIWFDGGIFDPADAGRTGHLHDGKQESDFPPGNPYDTDYVTGACLLLRTDAIRQVGLLPEDYFLYFEETDYCRQMDGRGWRLIVNPQARAHHFKRSSGALPTVSYVYYMRRNKEIFARRLGLDVSAAVAHFDRVWTVPWRTKVSQRAPEWLSVFDDIIALAETDAKEGRTGRQDLLSRFPSAVGQAS
jgi:GT2 family glycosyltransferase